MRIRVERHVQFSNCAIKKKKKKKKKKQLSGTICLISLPPDVECMNLGKNNFEGSLDFTRLPESMKAMYLYENRFSGTIDLGNLPKSMTYVNVRKNALTGRVRIPPTLSCWSDERETHRLFEGNTDLIVEKM